MESSVITLEQQRKEAVELLDKLDKQLEYSYKHPFTVNLTGKPLPENKVQYNWIDLNPHFKEGLNEILDFDVSVRGGDVSMAARRLNGLIADIHPGIPENPHGVRYLIDGPAWWVGAVVHHVSKDYSIAIPMDNDSIITLA